MFNTGLRNCFANVSKSNGSTYWNHTTSFSLAKNLQDSNSCRQNFAAASEPAQVSSTMPKALRNVDIGPIIYFTNFCSGFSLLFTTEVLPNALMVCSFVEIFVKPAMNILNIDGCNPCWLFSSDIEVDLQLILSEKKWNKCEIKYVWDSLRSKFNDSHFCLVLSSF